MLDGFLLAGIGTAYSSPQSNDVVRMQATRRTKARTELMHVLPFAETSRNLTSGILKPKKKINLSALV